MKDQAAAFAPGHITGFFEIRDEADDPAQIGSRGAGFSVELGVLSRVQITHDGVPGVTILHGGKATEATTTRRAIDLLVGTESLGVTVEQRMDLPVGQGFGMSAAGALSAALALTECLGRPRREAVWAAHCAEVMQRTGLGDVVGSDLGGFEVRLKPGIGPYGEIVRWSSQAASLDVVLGVVGSEVSTKRVLTDPRRRAEIMRAGRRAVDEFAEERDLGAFITLARRFATETQLATPGVLKAWSALGDAPAGQAQLGSSVFAFGDPKANARRLEPLGPTWTTKVATEGARVVGG